EDGGESWLRVREAPDEGPLLAVWFEDARHGIAVGAFGVALETRDGGGHWTRTDVAEGELRDRHLNGIVAVGDGTLLITAEAGALFRSSDGGRTWSLQKLPYNGSLWGGLALRDGAVLVFGMRGHVLRSDDQGRTFADIPSGTNQSFTAGTQQTGGTIVLVGLGGTIAQSKDGGRTYEVIVRPERQTFTSVVEAASGQLVLTATTGVVKPGAATR
ncbi:MAG TPA: YCF48-related protein, partial [Casimicrobiaceae bacterium]|nr:YCF48-related protein [Casimicrobiaceae bacterium]